MGDPVRADSGMPFATLLPRSTAILHIYLSALELAAAVEESAEQSSDFPSTLDAGRRSAAAPQ
jgi:hypothetical protein